jgi:hypothetical protein
VADLDLPRDQDLVADRAREYQRLWLDDRLDEANAQWSDPNRIVEQWTRAGRIAELLTPLLDDEATAVRYAAASYLIRESPSERAWEVLQDVHDQRTPADFVFKMFAKLLLMENGRL